MSDQPFWPSKRVLLTGHTGFKGSWLALWLQRLGAEVTGYALEPPTEPNLFTVARLGEGMTSVIADIRDPQGLERAFAAARPQVVFHLAAQPLVRYGYRHPVETYATNVMGAVHLMEAVRRTPGVRAVVIVTSDKCYDNREWVWGYRECEPMGGYDPYSSSKGCAELVTQSYRQSYFNPTGYAEHGVAIASARAGNVIGGGDWALDRLVPDILRAMTASEPVVIRSPHAVRPWQHVLEPLAGYLRLAERLYAEGPDYGEGWNFGPGDDDARPVQWIVERLIDLWNRDLWNRSAGSQARWLADPAAGPHEAHHLKLDCSKARGRLGWAPRWPLTEALLRIVAWQRALLDGQDMRDWSLAEIADFEQAGAANGGDRAAADRPNQNCG